MPKGIWFSNKELRLSRRLPAMESRFLSCFCWDSMAGSPCERSEQLPGAKKLKTYERQEAPDPTKA